jgi:hypothetical protein
MGGVWMLAPAILLLLAAPAQAQLARQTFEVNLGSAAIPGPLPFDEPFFLSAPAPDNLLQVRLWAVRETQLARANCARVQPASETDLSKVRIATANPSARIPMKLTSSWSRAGLDSLTRFELLADPLDPNRDYTFCFHLLRKPTAADSIAFSSRATSNISTALAANAGKVLTEGAMVDLLQQALIDALPPADSVVHLESPSIFEKPVHEPHELRTARLNRLITIASNYLQNASNHDQLVTALQGSEAQTANALDQVFRDPALLRLAAMGRASIPAGLDSARLLTTAMLAGRISQFRGRDAAVIAQGVHPLDGSPTPGPPRNLASATAPAALAPYLENLARTRSALRDLAALAALAAERPQVRASKPLVAELHRLGANVRTAITAVGAEMQGLLNLSASLDQRSGQVQRMVASVQSLDFARIALRSTTSGTYVARANTYISLDAGLLAAQDVDQIAPYLGVNLYLRPVNKNAPLTGCLCLGRRASLTLGITTGSIAEKDRIQDTFTGHSILTGLGFRMTDYWRVSGGLLFVRTYRDEAPAELRFGAVPSIATSLDIDIVGLLGKAGTFLFP